MSQDGQRAYVANSASSTVSVIDLEKRAVVASIRVGALRAWPVFLPDGQTVVVSNRGDGTVSLIDSGRTHRPRNNSEYVQDRSDIAILPDSSKAFVACSGSAQVASIDLKTDKLMALLDVGKSPSESRAQARRRRTDGLQFRFQ